MSAGTRCRLRAWLAAAFCVAALALVASMRMTGWQSQHAGDPLGWRWVLGNEAKPAAPAPPIPTHSSRSAMLPIVESDLGADFGRDPFEAWMTATIDRRRINDRVCPVARPVDRLLLRPPAMGEPYQ